MSTDSVLNVVLTANKASYSRTLRSATTEAKSFASVFSSTLGGLTAGLSIAGGAYLVKAQLDAIDATADLSERLNVEVEDLQRLRYACKLSGGSVELLDEKLSYMARSIGKAAAAGEGPTFDVLTKLGLSPAKLAALKPDEAFREIAEAISKIENPYQRAAAAQAIFGRGADRLLNTLMLGKRGLNEAASAAEKVGYAYNAVDAAKVQAANDSIDELGASWEGVKNTVAIELAPAIGDLAKTLRDLTVAHLAGEFNVVTVAAKALGAVISGISKLIAFQSLVLQQNALWIEKAALQMAELKAALTPGGEDDPNKGWRSSIEEREKQIDKSWKELFGNLFGLAPAADAKAGQRAHAVPFEADADAAKKAKRTPMHETVLKDTQRDYQLDAEKFRRLNKPADGHRPAQGDVPKRQLTAAQQANKLLERLVAAAEHKKEIVYNAATA